MSIRVRRSGGSAGNPGLVRVCGPGVGAEPEMSQRADARLRHPNRPRRLRACGSDNKSPGSPACRLAPGYWLNLASAPTRGCAERTPSRPDSRGRWRSTWPCDAPGCTTAASAPLPCGSSRSSTESRRRPDRTPSQRRPRCAPDRQAPRAGARAVARCGDGGARRQRRHFFVAKKGP